MVVAAVGAVDMAFFALEIGLDLRAGNLAIADLGLLEQIVDDLVLIERGAQLGGRHRVLLDVLDEPLAILGLILRSGLADEAVHFLLADLDAILGADFGQEETEANAANGDVAIVVGFGFNLGERGGLVVLMLGFVAQRP